MDGNILGVLILVQEKLIDTVKAICGSFMQIISRILFTCKNNIITSFNWDQVNDNTVQLYSEAVYDLH